MSSRQDRPEISDDEDELNSNNVKGLKKEKEDTRSELQKLKEAAEKKGSSSEEEDESEYDPYKVPLRFLSVFTPQELDMTKLSVSGFGRRQEWLHR